MSAELAIDLMQVNTVSAILGVPIAPMLDALLTWHSCAGAGSGPRIWLRDAIDVTQVDAGARVQAVLMDVTLAEYAWLRAFTH